MNARTQKMFQDVVSSYAIVTVDTKARSGVSLELNMSFLRPAPLGTTIYIQSDVVYIKEPLVTAEITFFTQVNFSTQVVAE